MKKVLERDDTSSRTMVLCVSSVTATENEADDTAAKQTDDDGDGQGAVNKIEVTTCALIFFFNNLNYVIRGTSQLVYR